MSTDCCDLFVLLSWKLPLAGGLPTLENVGGFLVLLWIFVSILLQLASIPLGVVIIGVAIYFMFRIPLRIVRRLSFRCPHCNTRCSQDASSCPHCGKNLSSSPFSEAAQLADPNLGSCPFSETGVATRQSD